VDSNIQQLFAIIAPNYSCRNIYFHLLEKFRQIDADVFHLQLAEFLKFIFLCSKYKNGFVPITGEIDLVWHEFIVHTSEYESFCAALPGKKFIHHYPQHLADYAQDKNKLDVVTRLLTWIPTYVHHFGEFTEPSSKHWMVVGFLQTHLQMSLNDINQFAKNSQSAIEKLKSV
jgi:hypothetical protein